MPEKKMLECSCGCRKFRRECVDVVEVLDIAFEGYGSSLEDNLIDDPNIEQSTAYQCLNCGRKFGEDGISKLKRALVIEE